MFRIGLGYDSHRVDASRPLMLGGVEIPGALGLAAHSDGDVLLHAVTDAMLGALAAGDIGTHFPDTDPKWKGVASGEFLRFAVERAGELGFVVNNCDMTVHCDQPKLGPHRDAIVASVAGLLNCPAGCVNLKGKTSEGMGFVGRGEGIVAQVILSLTTDAD